MMLANTEIPYMLNGFELEVAHIVWPTSVASQDIYGFMQDYQHKRGVQVSSFFTNMEAWLIDHPVVNAKSVDYKNSLWDDVLSKLFTNHTERWSKAFIIILDEIPLHERDLDLIGEIRDSLKMMPNVALILSGTNSKAANMIGLTNSDASSRATHLEHAKWSYLMTRVPQYFVEASRHRDAWKEIQRLYRPETKKSYAYEQLRNAINLISISIQNHGNPRLIDFSITALIECLRCNTFTFDIWQSKLSAMNLASKFMISKLRYGKEILISQANLLLSASAVFEIADSMIHRHYAQRAFPDNGLHFGLADVSGPCGGWLHIAPLPWRCLGHPLYAKNSMGKFPHRPSSDWQIAIFQPVFRDPILYLASCWADGFFSIEHVGRSRLVFTSMTVTKSVWKSNSIGRLNFQNPNAPINTGARLEVAVTMAIMNAGAVSKVSSIPLHLYLSTFLAQLDIQTDNQGEMMLDEAWYGLYIPRYIFPFIGAKTQKIPKIPGIGILERTANRKKMDAILHNVHGTNFLGVQIKRITFEMKDRKYAITTANIGEIAGKLIRRPGGIGICCVKTCPQFWTRRAMKTATRDPDKSVLVDLWRSLQDTLVGVVYLVNSHGEVICHTIDSGRHGRFILVETG
jgi:hypothetical protein